MGLTTAQKKEIFELKSRIRGWDKGTLISAKNVSKNFNLDELLAGDFQENLLQLEPQNSDEIANYKNFVNIVEESKKGLKKSNSNKNVEIPNSTSNPATPVSLHKPTPAVVEQQKTEHSGNEVELAEKKVKIITEFEKLKANELTFAYAASNKYGCLKKLFPTHLSIDDVSNSRNKQEWLLQIKTNIEVLKNNELDQLQQEIAQIPDAYSKAQDKRMKAQISRAPVAVEQYNFPRPAAAAGNSPASTTTFYSAIKTKIDGVAERFTNIANNLFHLKL